MILYLWQHTLPGLAFLLLAICAGVWVGVIIEESGWSRWLTFLLRPFLRWSRMPEISGVAFLTAFFSTRSANAMLAEAYEQKRLPRSLLFCTVVANSFPAVFAHMPGATFLLIPMLGWVGVAYLGIHITAGLLRVFAALLVARFLCPSVAVPHIPGDGGDGAEQPQPRSWTERCQRANRRTLKLLRKCWWITIPLYVLVSLCSYWGLFSALRRVLPGIVRSWLPVEAMAVVGAQMTGVVNGATVGRELWKTQALTGHELLIALVLGYVMAMPVRLLRHGLPSRLGIFPVKEALWVSGFVLGSRLVSIILVLIVVVVGYGML